MKNIYLDTETTDTKPGQIAELTMIVEDSTTHDFLGCYNYFFSVDEMTEGAENVHGFSIDALRELSCGQTFKDRLAEIQDILSDACLVAHNEAFDESFISMEFWRCGITYSPKMRVCTMKYFKDLIKIPAKYKRYGPYKNPKLSEVLEYLKIDPKKVEEYSKKLFGMQGTTFHDSRFDTTAMYVAVNVLRDLSNNGNTWLSQFCY